MAAGTRYDWEAVTRTSLRSARSRVHRLEERARPSPQDEQATLDAMSDDELFALGAQAIEEMGGLDVFCTQMGYGAKEREVFRKIVEEHGSGGKPT